MGLGLLDGIIGLKELKAKRKQQEFDNRQTELNESPEARSRRKHDDHQASIKKHDAKANKREQRRKIIGF